MVKRSARASEKQTRRTIASQELRDAAKSYPNAAAYVFRVVIVMTTAWTVLAVIGEVLLNVTEANFVHTDIQGLLICAAFQAILYICWVIGFAGHVRVLLRLVG